MSDYLSILPVELIEYIFDYLSIFDILSSICFVNKSLYSICLIYSRFRLDFNCVAKKKKQFEFICNQLPNLASRIVSLNFNNNNNRITNVIINRFFSSITINNIFSILYSITLNEIDSNTWNLIRTRLSLFISLKSICIYDSNQSTSTLISLIFHDVLFTIKSLKHLYLHTSYGKNEIITISSSLIQTLAIEDLTVIGIQINLHEIFPITPMLHKLNIELSDNQFSDMNIIFQPSIFLQKLSITINSLTMLEMKYLLSSMICLTHLRLNIFNVDNYMINGDAWIPLITRIILFEFVFKISKSININLNSFRTQFWLEEKKWYVTYDQWNDDSYSFLYTNPCFKDYFYPYPFMKKTLVTESTGLEPTTCPYTKYLIFDTELPMSKTHLCRFTRVETLIIKNNFNNSLEYLTNYIDLSRITDLIQGELEIEESNNKFVQILYNLPRLRSLCLHISTLILLFDRHWPQIINLNMKTDTADPIESLSSKQINALWRSFTHLEWLSFDRQSVRNLSKLFNTITMTLSNISIRHYGYINNLNPKMVTRQWLEQNTKLCHFEYFQHSEREVYLWL